MTQEPLTLYKLIVLYMLDQMGGSLTTAHVFDFILEKEYTDFLTLQQAICALKETNMISTKSFANRTLLSITDEGHSTLSFFENQISKGIKEDVRQFLKEQGNTLRNDLNVTAQYYKLHSGEYETSLSITEKNSTLLSLKLSVPTEEEATSICENWQKKHQDLYQTIVSQLF